MRSDIKLHIPVCLLVLLLFIIQPVLDLEHSIFGYFLLLGSVYSGRWICGQSYKANWFDMLRMFFLGFFTLSVGGLAIFANYVEPGLRITHYLESLINISCCTAIFLLLSFFVTRIIGKKERQRQNHRPAIPDKNERTKG